MQIVSQGLTLEGFTNNNSVDSLWEWAVTWQRKGVKVLAIHVPHIRYYS